MSLLLKKLIFSGIALMNNHQQPLGLQHYCFRHEEQTGSMHGEQTQATAVCHLWSSIIEFYEPILAQEALTLVQLAYGEMVTKFPKSIVLDGCKIPEHRLSECFPAAMAAFICPGGRKVILASSIKKLRGDVTVGPREYLQSKPLLKEALNRAIPRDSQHLTHRTGGCAELVAYDVWSRSKYRSGNDAARSSIITWGTTIGDKKPRLRSPCTDVPKNGGWGCAEFVKVNHIDPIQGQNIPILSPLPDFRILQHDHPGFPTPVNVECS
jgi:hypothetical protein